jgi:hypothetical protein
MTDKLEERINKLEEDERQSIINQNAINFTFFQKSFFIIISILTTISLGLIGFIFSEMRSIDHRITKVEHSAIYPDDMDKMNNKIDELNRCINELNVKIQRMDINNEKIVKIESSLEKLAESQYKVEQRLIKIEMILQNGFQIFFEKDEGNK